MTTQNGHTKVALSKNDAGTIRYCEGCDVLEMELGAISIRLAPDMFKALSALLTQAKNQLSLHKYGNMETAASGSLQNIFH